MEAMEGVESLSLEVEVMAKPMRRRYTAGYKLRILREADACTRVGEVGALLRREGLYSSNLTAWRKQRGRRELEGLAQKKRVPSRREKNPLADKVKALERENTRLKARAERAEGLVELQKKVSEILGIELKRNPEWKVLLEEFSDRFILGTDTGSLTEFVDTIGSWREVLKQLSPATARKLAHQNAERLLNLRR